MDLTDFNADKLLDEMKRNNYLDYFMTCGLEFHEIVEAIAEYKAKRDKFNVDKDQLHLPFEE